MSESDRMIAPLDIQIVGEEVAIRWTDSTESFFQSAGLRAASPSAETQGERDILGNLYGGNGRAKYPGVSVTGWELVGNYAVRLEFSDGHRTGLYSYDYLRKLAGL